MRYTIEPIYATPDLLYALYTSDRQLIKEFYDIHTAELAALHLDAIGGIPDEDDPPIDWPIPGSEPPGEHA